MSTRPNKKNVKRHSRKAGKKGQPTPHSKSVGQGPQNLSPLNEMCHHQLIKEDDDVELLPDIPCCSRDLVIPPQMPSQSKGPVSNCKKDNKIKKARSAKGTKKRPVAQQLMQESILNGLCAAAPALDDKEAVREERAEARPQKPPVVFHQDIIDEFTYRLGRVRFNLNVLFLNTFYSMWILVLAIPLRMFYPDLYLVLIAVGLYCVAFVVCGAVLLIKAYIIDQPTHIVTMHTLQVAGIDAEVNDVRPPTWRDAKLFEANLIVQDSTLDIFRCRDRSSHTERVRFCPALVQDLLLTYAGRGFKVLNDNAADHLRRVCLFNIDSEFAAPLINDSIKVARVMCQESDEKSSAFEAILN